MNPYSNPLKEPLKGPLFSETPILGGALHLQLAGQALESPLGALTARPGDEEFGAIGRNINPLARKFW